MRVALVIAAVTLTLGLTSRPTSALQGNDSVSPLVSLQMIDAQIGWAVTAGCDPCPLNILPGLVLRTTNGGTKWEDITPVDSSGKRTGVIYLYALDSQIALAGKWVRKSSHESSIEIFRTVDGGHTWKASANPGWSSISFLDPREGWLIHDIVGYTGHTDVDIYRSADGGETWIKVSSNTDRNSGLTNLSGMTGITFFNSTIGLITGLGIPSDWQYLYVTRDGGRTWQEQKLPLPPQLTPHWEAYLWPPRVFTAQDGILRADYTTSHRSDPNAETEHTRPVTVFYVTRDGGTTWMYTTAVPVSENRINPRPRPSTFIDMSHGWVKSEDTLYMTSDGGRQWTKVHSSQLFGDVTHLAFISQEVGWAVRNTDPYGGGARQTFPFLLKTLDGGRTWTTLAYSISR